MNRSRLGWLFWYQAVAGGGSYFGAVFTHGAPPYMNQRNQNYWNCWHRPYNRWSRQTPDLHVCMWETGFWGTSAFLLPHRAVKMSRRDDCLWPGAIMSLMGSQEMSKLREEGQHRLSSAETRRHSWAPPRGSAKLQLFMLPLSMYRQWHTGHAWVHLRKAWTVCNRRSYDRWSPGKIFTNAATHNT